MDLKVIYIRAIYSLVTNSVLAFVQSCCIAIRICQFYSSYIVKECGSIADCRIICSDFNCFVCRMCAFCFQSDVLSIYNIDTEYVVSCLESCVCAGNVSVLIKSLSEAETVCIFTAHLDVGYIAFSFNIICIDLSKTEAKQRRYDTAIFTALNNFLACVQIRLCHFRIFQHCSFHAFCKAVSRSAHQVLISKVCVVSVYRCF